MILDWATEYKFWIILGFSFLIFELIGLFSYTIFVAIGSILMAGVLLLIPGTNSLSWYLIFFIWSGLCLISLGIVKAIPNKIKRNKSKDDINHY